MYPKYAEIADKLEIGKTYTLFKYGEFGFPYALQFKLTRKEIKPYAQYQESLLLGFIEKGKRKERGIRFYGDNRFAIWEGFVSPNAETYDKAEVKDGVTVSRSSFSCFDGGYMTRALASVSVKPLIVINKEEEE